jgi:hypothetical protein
VWARYTRSLLNMFRVLPVQKPIPFPKRQYWRIAMGVMPCRVTSEYFPGKYAL